VKAKTEMTFVLFRRWKDTGTVCIPFWFDTTDPRSPRGKAEWTASSGQIWRHLVDQPLSIRWDQDRIILQVGFGGGMTIPAQ